MATQQHVLPLKLQFSALKHEDIRVPSGCIDRNFVPDQKCSRSVSVLAVAKEFWQSHGCPGSVFTTANIRGGCISWVQRGKATACRQRTRVAGERFGTKSQLRGGQVAENGGKRGRLSVREKYECDRGMKLIACHMQPVGGTTGSATSAEGDDWRPVFTEGKHLSDICTWGIGGPARLFIEVHSAEQMALTLQYCWQRGIRYLVVGKGSNCLFDDRGFNGCVILNRIAFIETSPGGIFRVGAGVAFNTLSIRCSRDGYGGLEFACGIPGTVGGAVYMNAGAHNQETADVLESVEVVSGDGSQTRVLRRDCGQLSYSYRTSPFQNSPECHVITGATFKLHRSQEASQLQRSYMDRELEEHATIELESFENMFHEFLRKNVAMRICKGPNSAVNGVGSGRHHRWIFLEKTPTLGTCFMNVP